MPQAGFFQWIVVLATVLACQVRAQTPDGSDPIPVLDGMLIRSPGPRALHFDGLAADPSSIGNFQGLVALAYMRAMVRDATGRRFLMADDIRIFAGDYVSADGVQRQGVFAFV